MKTIRCTDCGTEFTDEELVVAAEPGHCPVCKTTGLPCRIADDVTLKINWHELRILGMWASNYVSKLDLGAQRTLKLILARLQAQHPDKGALTLFGEVQESSTWGLRRVPRFITVVSWCRWGRNRERLKQRTLKNGTPDQM